MCIGIPLQIVNSNESRAWCRDSSGQEFDIDMMLIGKQAPGTWILSFLNTARETISEQRAKEINLALQGLTDALQGKNIDHLFADLIDREPPLPEFLKSKK